MADIRVTPVLDDFERANEYPIQPPWQNSDFGGWPTQRMALENGHIRPWACCYPWSTSIYHETQSFSGDVEAWGQMWTVAELREGWAIYLITDVGGTGAMDGYSLRATNPIGGGGTHWAIRRYGNMAYSVLATAGPTSPLLGEPHLMLFRRNGVNLEGWYSTDAGANWTQAITVPNSEFTTNIYIGFGSQTDDGTGPGWSAVGGGVAVNRTQDIRIKKLPS